jgi:hypothetical protein
MPDGVAMPDKSTIEVIDDWKEKERQQAHNDLEELRKPDELNELIMTKVNILSKKVSQQCDPSELRNEIATLTELFQIRHLKMELRRRQLDLRM